jgi:hypothetical protein
MIIIIIIPIHHPNQPHPHSEVPRRVRAEIYPASLTAALAL